MQGWHMCELGTQSHKGEMIQEEKEDFCYLKSQGPPLHKRRVEFSNQSHK